MSCHDIPLYPEAQADSSFLSFEIYHIFSSFLRFVRDAYTYLSTDVWSRRDDASENELVPELLGVHKCLLYSFLFVQLSR
jgi:hypothetical protein